MCILDYRVHLLSSSDRPRGSPACSRRAFGAERGEPSVRSLGSAAGGPALTLFALGGSAHRPRRTRRAPPAGARGCSAVGRGCAHHPRGRAGGSHIRAQSRHADLRRRRDPPPPDRSTVLFFGSYHWPPNVDAAEWMAWHIWPHVLEHAQDARLVLAGLDPKRSIARLADPVQHIDARGFVDDAVATTRAATFCAVPLACGRRRPQDHRSARQQASGGDRHDRGRRFGAHSRPARALRRHRQEEFGAAVATL